MKDTKFNSIQSNKVLIFVEFFLNYFPVALAFLMPVFFLTTFTDYFEQGKFVLFLTGTISLAVFWVLKLLLRSSVYITRSKLDVPIWMYILVFTLSSVLSLNQTDSLFGSQLKWVPSLLSLITFVLYFYTISTNMRSLQAIKHSIFAFIIGGTVSTIVGLCTYYGIKLGNSALLGSGSFNLAGTVENLSLIAVISFLLSISVLLNTKEKLNKSLSLIAAVINIFLVVLISQLASIVIAVTGVIYLVVTSNINKVRTELSLIGIITLIVVGATFLPATSKLLMRNNLKLETQLLLTESWSVSATALRDKPFQGWGPNTFNKVYSLFKPSSVNNSPRWGINFNKPYNQAMDELVSLGLLGVIVGIYFYFRLYETIRSTIDKKEEFTPIHQALIIPVAAIPLYYLLGNSNTISSFIFYHFLAIFISVIAGFQKNKNSEDIFITITSFSSIEVSDTPEKKEKFQYFAILPILGIAGALGYYSSYNILGEYYFRRSINAAITNDAYGVYNNQIEARNVFPRRDAYHTAIAQTNLNLAISLANKKDLSAQEKEVIQNLISESIRSARLATETLDPLNINNWIVRANVYKSLIGVTNDADQWTISALNNAISLDPANPNLRLELGSIYFSKQDYLTAANLFKQATQLKNDYANAHYNFAQALKGAKINDLAINELEITKSLLPANSPDVEKINAEISTIKASANVAGTTTERKSTEVLETKTANTSNEKQTITKPDDNKTDNSALEKIVNEKQTETQTKPVEKK